jgi:hypothetical protein
MPPDCWKIFEAISTFTTALWFKLCLPSRIASSPILYHAFVALSGLHAYITHYPLVPFVYFVVEKKYFH